MWYYHTMIQIQEIYSESRKARTDVPFQRKKFKQFEFWRQNSGLLFVVENKQPMIRLSFGAKKQTF